MKPMQRCRAGGLSGIRVCAFTLTLLIAIQSLLMLVASTQPPLIYAYILYSTSILDGADEYTDADPSQNLDGKDCDCVLGTRPSRSARKSPDAQPSPRSPELHNYRPSGVPRLQITVYDAPGCGAGPRRGGRCRISVCERRGLFSLIQYVWRRVGGTSDDKDTRRHRDYGPGHQNNCRFQILAFDTEPGQWYDDSGSFSPISPRRVSAWATVLHSYCPRVSSARQRPAIVLGQRGAEIEISSERTRFVTFSFCFLRCLRRWNSGRKRIANRRECRGRRCRSAPQPALAVCTNQRGSCQRVIYTRYN